MTDPVVPYSQRPQDFIEYIGKLPEHPRLGRTIIELDSRSRAFAATPSSSEIKSSSWRRGRPYDQDGESSCTGQARKGLANTRPFSKAMPYRRRRAIDAYQLYRYAQRFFDSWDGEEPVYFGTSVIAVFRAAKAMGITDREYLWLFGHQQALQYVSNDGPFVMGIGWTDSMFYPTSAGEIVPRGPDVGGHAIEAARNDARRRRLWIPNSWGVRWGIGGWCWLSYDAFAERLADNGEAVTLAAVSA